MSALKGLRILELCDGVAGEYCGKLLSDFGAEVVKLENPGSGSATRRMAPMAPDVEAPEASGLFAYLNTGKRSATLDLQQESGRAILHRLFGAVDVVIDDHRSGWLEDIGLAPGSLEAKHPRMVLCSITPFGQNPPPELAHAHALNVFHASGWGHHSPSEPDIRRPPLKGAGRFLADYESGMNAALCIVSALFFRQGSGRGQFIDISQRETLVSLADFLVAQLLTGNMETSKRRSAFDLAGPGTFFECTDGWLYLWMSEPGHWEGIKALLGAPAWMAEFPERWLELHVTKELVARCRSELATSLRPYRKNEIAARAQELGVPLVPVNDASDLLQSPQIAARRFFRDVTHPRLGRHAYPTVPYRLSATPASISAPAPLLGQDTAEILGTDAGCDAEAMRNLREAGVI